ncbi:esterase-like activity of phytase family protein [Novosphingobium aerophilum]|uniref:esterase-like activity of phytase family protein n=1 Tax=Novosphingobium TaxID=165696 RepID=UPI002D77D51A|nr:esterase-like activity of phytase family protein [Novosphingobium sp. RL4]WRT93323.1 esterase-like activity of phytase family protein [Novosphingobium sp. RL4]
MRRTIALLALLSLLPLTWGRSPHHPKFKTFELAFVPLDLPPPERTGPRLGPFALEQVWLARSRTHSFGSYSSLLLRPGGMMLALSDSGDYLEFRAPGESQADSRIGELALSAQPEKADRDVESATQDDKGTIWLGLEGRNAIYRMGADYGIEARVRPPVMADWGVNSGPEAMTRLQDGRFVLLREGYVDWSDHLHEAALFAGDPTAKGPRGESAGEGQAFTLDAPTGFSPTDMVQMPDGRLLILMRRLIWPMPQRFAGRIAIGDPRTIRPGGVWKVREVARLSSDLPIDNFEGIAIAPRKDGRLTVWLISDDNFSPLQRTLLWKLSVDPADLP